MNSWDIESQILGVFKCVLVYLRVTPWHSIGEFSMHILEMVLYPRISVIFSASFSE